MPFSTSLKTKPADVASIKKLESGRTVSFLFEETDSLISERILRKAWRLRCTTLSVFTLELDAGAK